MAIKDEYTFEYHVEFNDKYFPRVDIKDRERYYPIYKYKNREFTYDKKDKLVIVLFKDDEEITNMGKTKAPWREMEAVGLREENWKNKAARDEYLYEYCFDLDSEVAELVAQAEREFSNKAVNEEVDSDVELHKYNESLTVVHDELNPIIWDNNNTLKPEIKEKILALVEEFQSTLDIPLHILDIEIVGSNASYNYTDKSDVDVHIITNFDDYGYPQELVQSAMNAFKTNFNRAYDIDYKGYNVELYVENVNSAPTTNGIYSVVQDKWIKQPEKLVAIEVELEPMLTDYRRKINDALESGDIEEIIKLIDELYILRRNSLMVDGENGAGNLIFKQIRNDGLLDGLKNKRIALKSDELSVESLKESIKDDTWFAAQIYSSMQFRTFYILGKNKDYIMDAYNLFMQALNAPSDAEEHDFRFLDEYIESHDLVLLDDEINAVKLDKNTIQNNETGEVYNINIIKNFSSRF